MIHLSKRRKLKFFFIPLAIIFLVAIAAGILFSSTEMPESFTFRPISLTDVADGTYSGFCDNSLVKAEVAVTVTNQTIAQIKLIRHVNGLGGAAETIPDHVIETQSLQVDTISGATYSSHTILKAIEHALMENGGIYE